MAQTEWATAAATTTATTTTAAGKLYKPKSASNAESQHMSKQWSSLAQYHRQDEFDNAAQLKRRPACGRSVRQL